MHEQEPMNQPDPNLLERVAQYALNKFQTVEDRALGTLAVVGATASLGGAVELTTPNKAIANAHTASCETVPGDVSVGYVNKAALPFAQKVVNAYHSARRSEVRVKKNQPEMAGLTYRHLTEVDITESAKLSNGESGVYTYTAQFLGKIIPKDMVAVDIETNRYESIGIARVERPVYDFNLTKTKGDSENPNEGLQWRMEHDYNSYAGGNADDLVISRLSTGFEMPGRYAMTAPILKAGIRQAENVIQDMTKHRNITKRTNLNTSKRAVEACD